MVSYLQMILWLCKNDRYFIIFVTLYKSVYLNNLFKIFFLKIVVSTMKKKIIFFLSMKLQMIYFNKERQRISMNGLKILTAYSASKSN